MCLLRTEEEDRVWEERVSENLWEVFREGRSKGGTEKIQRRSLVKKID